MSKTSRRVLVVATHWTSEPGLSKSQTASAVTTNSEQQQQPSNTFDEPRKLGSAQDRPATSLC